MDLRLKQERLESYACVLDRTVEDVFTSDVIVPDALEDVGEILFTDGDFCLWRLDLGSGSAEAEGEWSGSVCYRAENDGSLQHFPVKVGVRLRMHDDAIEPDLRPFAACRVTECSVQIMNTRKLRFKVRACLSLQGYVLQTTELTSGVEESPADLYFKTEQMTASMVTDVSEQVFTAGERITLREAPEGRSLIAFHSEIAADQPQRSGARAILHGVVRSTVFYQGEESKAPICETIETAFSQLLDLENMSENDTLRCRLQLTSADLILHEGPDLETDFHIVAQTLCSRETEFHYLSDAYSVSNPLELQRAPIKSASCGNINTVTANADATLKQLPDGASMFSVMTHLGSVRMTQASVSGTAAVTVLFSDSDGSLQSCEAEAQFEQALPENTMVSELRLCQPDVSKASGEYRVYVPVQIDCAEMRQCQAQQITAVKRLEGDGRCAGMPSLTLIPRSETMDLWETAKHYGSSIEAIRAANIVKDGEKVPEYCIIPRVRVG